nr:DNA-binding domain-containing protein [Qipengyuania mesophila]
MAQRQAAVLGAILDEEAALPEGWGERQARGLAIYRNNYRSALVEALRATFERTERLVGADAFARAAAHHCIMHPPSGWTLDLVGDGFAETCAALFAGDPDVAELAALEWAMHLAFTARDAVVLSPEGFAAATADFGEREWDRLSLALVPSLRCVAATRDLVRLWSSLARDGDADLAPLDALHVAVVWREDERPVFVLRPEWEGSAIDAFHAGASWGDVCAAMFASLGEDRAIAEAGAMLARWVAEGWIEAIAQ